VTGSCVSKMAARGDQEGKAATPLPPVKEISALSPVAEEVKEMVLPEMPAPPRLPTSPPEPPVKRRQGEVSEAEVGSGSESASVGSAAKTKARREQEAVRVMSVVKASPEKARARRASPSRTVDTLESKPKPNQGGGAAGNNGQARSPSPRRQPGGLQPPVPPNSRPRREPAVVSAFSCRSGRFSPSAARRAAESAVWRTHSARFGDADRRCRRSGR
jgi:hypothetical protein